MYSIKLPNFEGPLDLLLFFIRRDELNIYDIPISSITKEFLDFVRVMEIFDLELAGEFLVMASTLMHIKTQMLLPRDLVEKPDGTLEEEDPRSELVQKLLEYKRFKEAAQNLNIFAENQRYAYYRKLFDADLAAVRDAEPFKNATLFDLLKALKKALEREPAPVDKAHVINIAPVSVDEKSDMIRDLLKARPHLRFFELLEGATKIHIVVTFLAVLEMVRNQVISIEQSELFDDITILPFQQEVVSN
ncbi:MAG: segregation/condensation protein A [Bacteroidota bacterium]